MMPVCVCQATVGGVGPRHEDDCHTVAAQERGPHGGLHRVLGPYIATLDPGSCFGAAHLPQVTERGNISHTYRSSSQRL